jgi:hypothetical protein
MNCKNGLKLKIKGELAFKNSGVTSTVFFMVAECDL